MKSDRKQRSDSAAAALEGFKNANSVVQPPDGVELRTDEERTIWSQFTRARARDAWRDFDLVLLAKVVKTEVVLRSCQAQLDATGLLTENKKGTPIENPMLRVYDTLLRQQLAIIRSMSLNSTGKDPRTLNASAANEEEARKVIANNGPESLLAAPVH